MGDWRSDPLQSGILLVDIQQKLFPAMYQREVLLQRARVLCQAAATLPVPVFITEQVPEKLGPTLADLTEVCTPEATWSKQTFSAYPVVSSQSHIKQWVVAGIEAHICVRQTVLDLKHHDKSVTVLADVTASRHPADREQALDEFRAQEIRVLSLESLLFEWLGSSEHTHFRDISRLVREL